jgi:hypothetical protein
LTVLLIVFLLVALAGSAVALAAVLQVRKIKPTAIDPFAVGDPWRGMVQRAVRARTQFDLAVAGIAAGPLQDRLVEVGTRMSTGEAEVFRVAKLADAGTDVGGRLDVLVTQLEQAAAKVATLSVRDSGPAVSEELEALRQAIDDVTGDTGAPGLPPPP